MSNQIPLRNVTSDNNHIENTLQISDSHLLSEKVCAHNNGKLDTTKYQPDSQISKKRHQASISPYYRKIQPKNNGQQPPENRGQCQEPELLLKIGRLLKENIKINEKVEMYEALYPKICKQNESLEMRLQKYERAGRQVEEKLSKKNKTIDYLNDKVKLLQEVCDSKREIEQELQITKVENHNLNQTIFTLQNKTKQLNQALARADQRSESLENQMKVLESQIKSDKCEFESIIKQLEAKHHSREMEAVQNEINKSKENIHKLNQQYQTKFQQIRLQFEQRQNSLRKELEQRPTHAFNGLQKEYYSKNINVYNEKSTNQELKVPSHNLHHKNNQQNNKLFKKIQRKNQELITINKLLEEELEIANMKILELQRYQQDKLCEEYVGRLSRFKFNNQATHKPNKYGYPLSTLENIPQIGASYPQFITCMPQKAQVQPRTRIYSHYPRKTKP